MWASVVMVVTPLVVYLVDTGIKVMAGFSYLVPGLDQGAKYFPCKYSFFYW